MAIGKRIQELENRLRRLRFGSGQFPRSFATGNESATRAEERHSEQLAQPAAILNVCPDPILTVSRAGTILTLNRAAEAFYGQSKRELAGRNIDVLFAPVYGE